MLKPQKIIIEEISIEQNLNHPSQKSCPKNEIKHPMNHIKYPVKAQRQNIIYCEIFNLFSKFKTIILKKITFP
jgi:hypothetical protein